MKKLIIFLILFLYSFAYSLPSVFAEQATLSLSPAVGTFNKGCPFSVGVNLNTGGAQTDGTDAILIYDQSKLSATSITSGTIYPDFPGNSIREDLGKITISGLASISSPFSGQGLLATVNFLVKDTAQEGATQVKFDFNSGDKSNTKDSNVVQRETVVDILNSVVDGNYVVGTGTCTGNGVKVIGATGGAATPSGNISKNFGTGSKQLPNGGTKELTLTMAILGGTLTILGILGLILL